MVTSRSQKRELQKNERPEKYPKENNLSRLKLLGRPNHSPAMRGVHANQQSQVRFIGGKANAANTPLRIARKKLSQMFIRGETISPDPFLQALVENRRF